MLEAPRAIQLSLFEEPLHPAPAPDPRRLIRVAGRLVEYRFERRRRRTIRISIDVDGLAIVAPQRTAWRDIEDFVREKSAWILHSLDEWSRRPKPVLLRGASGETLPLFGEPVRIEIVRGRSSVERQAGRLCVSTRDPARGDAVLALLIRWLKSQTLAALAPRVAHYAGLLGVGVPRVEVSNARTQWGVCHASGRIRLSWRLVHVEPALADYVVAHEVAHLLHMNHSRRFWSAVGGLYPQWREARRHLNLADAALPRFAARARQPGTGGA
ncbi:MAG: M48 family metallopeptidase [Gammaproteobacteria bacterium]